MTAEQLVLDNMLALEVTGELNEKVTFGRGKKKQEIWLDMLSKAADFIGQELMGSDYSKIKIKISFAKMPNGQYGVADIKVGENAHKDGKFDLRISMDVGIKMMVTALCHELTHVAQVVRGDLAFVSDRVAIWQGEEIAISPDVIDNGSKQFEIAKYMNLQNIRPITDAFVNTQCGCSGSRSMRVPSIPAKVLGTLLSS